MLCFFANIVDPFTAENNKIFFSLTVELLGFFASLSLMVLSINKLHKTGLTRERHVPAKLFFAGISVWTVYCLVGIYSNFVVAPPTVTRSLDDAYIGYLSLISISMFILSTLGSRDIQKGFLASIFCFASLILVISLYTSRHVLWNESMSFYGIFTRADHAQGYQISRASGLARMLAVLLFFTFAILLVRFMKKLTYQFSFINILLSMMSLVIISLMILLQSRGAIIASFLSIVSVIFVIIVQKYKKNNFVILGLALFIIITGFFMMNFLFIPRFENSSFFSGWSGRGEIWQLIIRTQDNQWLGCGFQCDRILTGQSASNGFVYAYATSGLVGLISVLIICSLLSLVWIAFSARLIRSNYIELFSFFAIPFLLLRIISESGFLVFGFDLILLAVVSGILTSPFLSKKEHRL